MEEKSNTPTFAFPKITAEWPNIQTDRIEYTDPFKEGGGPRHGVCLRVATLVGGDDYSYAYYMIPAMHLSECENERVERMKDKLRYMVNIKIQPNFVLVGEDSEGNELRVGDKAELIILNTGSGVVEIVEHDGILQMYCPSQGYCPLNAALLRQDMHLEKILTQLNQQTHDRIRAKNLCLRTKGNAQGDRES